MTAQIGMSLTLRSFKHENHKVSNIELFHNGSLKRGGGKTGLYIAMQRIIDYAMLNPNTWKKMVCGTIQCKNTAVCYVIIHFACGYPPRILP